MEAKEFVHFYVLLFMVCTPFAAIPVLVSEECRLVLEGEDVYKPEEEDSYATSLIVIMDGKWCETFLDGDVHQLSSGHSFVRKRLPELS